MGNLGRNGAGQARPTVPANRQAATQAAQNARPVQARNPQRTNNAIDRQSRIDSRRGDTAQNNRPRRFNVDGHRAYGFRHNGNYYATWFWGGVPYYWYNGFWTPWVGFWGLFPWWYDFYYNAGDNGVSPYDEDQNDMGYDDDNYNNDYQN